MGKYILLDESEKMTETVSQVMDGWLRGGRSCPILSNYERFEPQHRTFMVLVSGALVEIRKLVRTQSDVESNA